MKEMNKIYLKGFSCYYRIEGRVFNSKTDRELKPDSQGRFKLKVFKGCYRYYRPPSWMIKKPEKLDVSSFNEISGFSRYREKDGRIYNLSGLELKTDKYNSYVLINDNNEPRHIRLKKLLP